MKLYVRRQLAARVNDIMKRNNGATIELKLGKTRLESLKALLNEGIGEEGYLRFDIILSQYGISCFFKLDDEMLIFTNKERLTSDRECKITTSFSFVYCELEPKVKNYLNSALSQVPTCTSN